MKWWRILEPGKCWEARGEDLEQETAGDWEQELCNRSKRRVIVFSLEY